MSNVIYLKQPVVEQPKEKGVSLASYSIHFVKMLLLWVVVGAVLGTFLPGWAITLICIGLLFIEKMPKK